MNTNPFNAHPMLTAVPTDDRGLFAAVKIGEKFKITGLNGTTYIKTENGIEILNNAECFNNQFWQLK